MGRIYRKNFGDSSLSSKDFEPFRKRFFPTAKEQVALQKKRIAVLKQKQEARRLRVEAKQLELEERRINKAEREERARIAKERFQENIARLKAGSKRAKSIGVSIGSRFRRKDRPVIDSSGST